MKFFLSKSGLPGVPAKHRDGFALILVLGALVIVTLLVVVMFTSAALERRMAASHLESQKASGLAMMAVDDAVGKLRNNIPAKSAWGVAPGRLVYWNGAQWARHDLHSGYSSGDRVALNVPTDAGGNYSLLSKNADFPNPPKMDVDWVYVFEDGTTAATIGTTKRVGGRYAYWTDVETSKVNLNTAGKAQIDFSPKPVSMGGRGDLQNLSGHPSSVDLSKLDSMTPALSLATYQHAGISAERDYINNKDEFGNSLASGDSKLAVGRFSSTTEWKSMVGNDIYERNKFDITTQGRAPEYSPWGQHRIWLNRDFFIGNAANSYSYSMIPMGAFGPGYMWDDRTDSLRFFVFPSFGYNTNWDPRHLNWFDMFYSSRGHIEGMHRQWLAQLSRRDWPGFGSTSFSGKWGDGEAECVAYNIIRAGDSMLSNAQGGTPVGSSVSPRGGGLGAGAADIEPIPGGLAADVTNNSKMMAHGLTALVSPTDSTRRVGATGRHPLVNEIGVRLQSTAAGAVTVGSAAFPEYVPGFVTAAPAGKVNLSIRPRCEFWLPEGFVGPPVFIDAAAVASIPPGYANFTPSSFVSQRFAIILTEISVESDGRLNGSAQHYSNRWTYTDSSASGGQRVYATGSGVNIPLCPEANTALSMNTYNAFSSIFVGPFDTNEPVSLVIRFRFSVTSGKLIDLAGDSSQALMTIPPNVTDRLEISATYDPLLGAIQDHSLEIDDPRLMHNLAAWRPSTDSSGATWGGMNSIVTTASSYGDSSKLAYPDLTLAHLYGRQGLYNKGNRMLTHNAVNIMGAPNIGWMSIVSTGVFRDRPWSTLSLQPANDSSTVPDWLIFELMSMPYDQSYASHTEGKVNLNASLYPWADADSTMARRGPIASVIGDRVPAGRRDQIVDNINNHTLASGAASFGLPTDVYVYAGQFCQIAGVSDTGANDFLKEKLPRDMIGLLTTQSADFKVHLVAQSLKQQQPGGTFVATAETRESVFISRTNDFGDSGYNPVDLIAFSEGNANTWPFMLDGSQGDKPRRRIYNGTGMDLDAAGPDKILGTADDLRPLFRYNIGRIETLAP